MKTVCWIDFGNGRPLAAAIEDTRAQAVGTAFQRFMELGPSYYELMTSSFCVGERSELTDEDAAAFDAAWKEVVNKRKESNERKNAT